LDKLDWRLLSRLFASTAKIGAVSFGGGYAMIPIMEEEFVSKQGWVDRKDILDIFAIAQSVPGVIALNTCTFIGYRVAGFPGSIAASVGVSLPSFLILMILSGFYIQFQENLFVVAAFAGIRACVVALVAGAVLSMGKTAISDAFGLVVALTGFTAIVLFGVNAVWCIFAAGVTGLVYSTFTAHRKGGG
jgi:chromate transporter